MNENVSINNNEYNDLETLDGFFKNDFRSILFKRIGGLSFNNPVISEAFEYIKRNVELPNEFSLSEMFLDAESVVFNSKPDFNAGNKIYCVNGVPDNKTSKIILKNSVGGIHALFSLKNGVLLDIDAAGGSIKKAETKRFVVLNEKKAKKLSERLKKHNSELYCVGEMISIPKIIFKKNGETFDSIDKAIIDSAEKLQLTISDNNREAFVSAYKAVASFALCESLRDDNVFRLALGGSFEDLVARAIGYYFALMCFKKAPLRCLFTDENNCNVAVLKPNVSDGDYVYLLRVKCDPNGMPDIIHYAQLQNYLIVNKKNEKIKDVLPFRENIDRVLTRLSNDKVEFVSINNSVECEFGIVVTVSRGYSVNGIQLGYFKGI